MANQTEIECGAILDISAVAQWCEQVKPALQANMPIQLKASQLQRIDTAGLQALLALIMSSKQRDIPVSWEEPSPALLQAASVVGLSDALLLG